MNGPEVYKFATRIIGPACHRALAMAEVDLSAVDWVVPHQANLRIIQAAAKEMKLPLERFLINIDRYANTSAASIPLAIAEALANRQIAADQTLLLAAFGAGMTWATALLQPHPR
jgi:3-oxoacyl-[acyl-carrier-protein] synthase-3